MVDHILYLWNNVIIEYLEDDNNSGNGFLKKIRNDKNNGLELFFKFIFEKTLPISVLIKVSFEINSTKPAKLDPPPVINILSFLFSQDV